MLGAIVTSDRLFLLCTKLTQLVDLYDVASVVLFLGDPTNGRAIGTLLRPSVCPCL